MLKSPAILLSSTDMLILVRDIRRSNAGPVFKRLTTPIFTAALSRDHTVEESAPQKRQMWLQRGRSVFELDVTFAWETGTGSG